MANNEKTLLDIISDLHPDIKEAADNVDPLDIVKLQADPEELNRQMGEFTNGLRALGGEGAELADLFDQLRQDPITQSGMYHRAAEIRRAGFRPKDNE